MSIFNKLKEIFNKKSGFIGHYNLGNWWESTFSEKERSYIVSKKPELINGKYNYTDKSAAQYLQELSLWFNTKKDNDISLKLLDKAEELVDDKKTLHFMYNSKIKSLYKKRKENKAYLEICVEYCKRDIELYENELRKMSFFKEKDTRIPAFQRLAIIYEKNKEYDKAIKICEKAIKYNMREKNKDSFEDRLNRLLSKSKS